MKRVLWIDLRHVPVHKRLGHLRTLAESGAEAVLLDKGDAHHGREGLAAITVDAKGGLRKAGKPVGRIVEVHDRASQQRAAKAKGILVAKPGEAAWKVIPLENLLASRAGGPVYAWTRDPKEAALLLTVLERGVDGIVLAPETPMDILECRAAMAHVPHQARPAITANARPPVLPPMGATPAQASSQSQAPSPSASPVPAASIPAPPPPAPAATAAPTVPPSAPPQQSTLTPAAAPRIVSAPLRSFHDKPQRPDLELSPPTPAPPPASPAHDPKPVAEAPRPPAHASAPATTGALAFEPARIARIERVGVAERVCVDATARFAPDEGLLVGSTARSFCLVLSENTQSDLVPPRPFRVNAGAVHSYVLAPGGRTSYLTELAAGAPVLAATPRGGSREMVTGRAKIEPRPHLLVAWQGPSGPGSVVLQEAETVRVATPDGPRAVTQLRVGDTLLAHPESAGRHTGLPVGGSLEER